MYTLFSTKPIEFVPAKYKEHKNPITFIFNPPTRSLVLRTQALLAELGFASKTADESTLGKLMNMTLEECVIDWKNVVDENGNPVKFSKETFNQFNDPEVLIDLYTAIQEAASGTEKNA